LMPGVVRLRQLWYANPACSSGQKLITSGFAEAHDGVGGL
jgi:hypothetical protein